jgi:hypothetical protein
MNIIPRLSRSPLFIGIYAGDFISKIEIAMQRGAECELIGTCSEVYNTLGIMGNLGAFRIPPQIITGSTGKFVSGQSYKYLGLNSKIHKLVVQSPPQNSRLLGIGLVAGSLIEFLIVNHVLDKKFTGFDSLICTERSFADARQEYDDAHRDTKSSHFAASSLKSENK